jgi:RimJ/RimL family protein N-acetyltransferase
MKLKVRQLTESDWSTLVSWWDWWPKWTAPRKEIMPQNGTGGVMVCDGDEGIVAGFLYLTNSESALIEWIISNPNYRHKENRKKAIKLVITKLEEVAKHAGKTYIFCSLQHPSLIKVHEELGYTKDPTPSSELAKNI